MIRRSTLAWPGPLPADQGRPRAVRLLAVSDEVERALEFERNRADLGRLDGILGCGDLEPDYLAFLADAFCVPLLYVRGNHDRGSSWVAGTTKLPRPLGTRVERLAGVPILGLSWPGEHRGQAIRDEAAAWRQAISAYLRARGQGPLIILSHMPPRGHGDTPEDHYHLGFAAYHWLCRRLDPRLWLHGHTSVAASADWRVDWGTTTLTNVTGAVLVELTPPDQRGATIEAESTRTSEDPN